LLEWELSGIFMTNIGRISFSRIMSLILLPLIQCKSTPAEPPSLLESGEDAYHFGALSSTKTEGAPDKIVRFAFYHLGWHFKSSADLLLKLGDSKYFSATAAAEVIQRVKPQVLFLSGLDVDAQELTVSKFSSSFLTVTQSGQTPIQYPHLYCMKSNNKLRSSCILSKFPFKSDKIRTFKNFAWEDMQKSKIPKNFRFQSKYKNPIQAKLDRLKSAKKLFSHNFADIPMVIGKTEIHLIHLLSAPTELESLSETVIPEQYQDESQFLQDYLSPETSQYIEDDSGKKGGIAANAHYVIGADFRMDPSDGPGTKTSINQLLDLDILNSNVLPNSVGATEDAAVEAGKNAFHIGTASNDTTYFSPETHGNLRTSFLIPNKSLTIDSSGVFWPDTSHPARRLIDPKVTNRRLIYVDLQIPSGL
jgi:hypothetical protein